ncbi:cell division protein SepF [Streptococcus dentiloxodontae]
MAFKDRFEKIISYFDTDEVTENEEPTQKPASQPRPAAAQQPQQRPIASHRPQVVQTRRPQSQTDAQETPPVRSLPVNRSQIQQAAQANPTKTTIAIKYPKRYEDAQEIVDLLIENECVLIDFQYMLEAQARRCLDFIDGASKVLTGNLQKVGSSMYLLTPINVVVDMEEIGLANIGQEANFDFDMKRR